MEGMSFRESSEKRIMYLFEYNISKVLKKLKTISYT